MSTFLIITFGVIYLVGLWTIQFLDKTLEIGDRVSNHIQHYMVLFIMWLLTPILMVLFVWQTILSMIK